VLTHLFIVIRHKYITTKRVTKKKKRMKNILDWYLIYYAVNSTAAISHSVCKAEPSAIRHERTKKANYR